ncbi:MAG: M23 family metallopeptidase [Fibrella sp.]|nr:M23 family metallopeptidase [Armatimonadota bacterium]
MQESSEVINNDYSIQVLDEERGDGTIAFNALLQNCLEAVVTVRLELQNMQCDKPIPVTANVVAGKARFNVANIWAKPSGKESRYWFKSSAILGHTRSGVIHRHIYALPYQGRKHLVSEVFPDRKAIPKFTQNEHFAVWRMPVGTKVCAARGGVVIAVRMDVQKKDASSGNYVVVRHGDGTYGRYIHLQQNGLFARLGQKVVAGQLLALSGASGAATYPQFAFQVYQPISGYTQRGFPLTFRTAKNEIIPLKPGKQYYL